MKLFFVFIITFIGLTFMLPGCRHTEAEPVSVRLEKNTVIALKELNQTCTRLEETKQYDSVVNICKEVLIRFPERPTGNADTVARESGELMNRLVNMSRPVKRESEVAILMDSLLNSGSPFLRERCNYYLLSIRAFAASLNDDTKDLELAKSFLALPPCPDMPQELLSCHLMAQVFQFGKAPADTYIGLQERAVTAFRRCGEYADAIRILPTMGYYYRRSGMYEKAVECLQEAYDYYLNEGQNRKDKAIVMLLGDLSNLYASLRLYDKAIEFNSQAIEASLRNNSYLLGDLYRMRASMSAEVAPDSCLYYYDKSIAEMKRIKQSSGVQMGTASRANLLVERTDLYPDSLPSALKALETLYANDNILPMQQNGIRLWLGMALWKSGDIARGKELMEQSAKEYVTMQWNENIHYSYKQLMDLYVKQGMKTEIANLFPAYAAIRDTIEKNDKMMASIAANVRYETGRKEQENRALVAEVALKEQSLVYTRLILGLSLLLLIATAGLLLQYRRMRRQEREKHLSEIRQLLSAQQELNRRNEMLNGKLEEVTHNEIIDNVRQQLNPTLLSGNDEIRFRQAFAALYPRYLPELRSRCPEVTKSDELVCMLIYLNQNTDEVALSLGISRASVNSARSRIRKKLGLKKEDSLEEALRF